MPELTREEKLKLIEKLPQRLQDFLYSEDTGAVLLYFGKKYNLPDEKVRLLSKLITDIVLGIIPIASLAQEINSKITADLQSSMHMAQELYTEFLSPVMSEQTPLPIANIGTPNSPQANVGAVPAPQTTVAPIPPSAPPMPVPAVPSSIPTPMQEPISVAPTPKPDQYREPISTGPEIVDLRKTPPLPIQMPVAAAPIPPSLKQTPPLTFTKPIEKKPTPPLIEANPHKIVEQSMANSSTSPKPNQTEPQFIIRPPGLAPTDAPKNILDLRRDRGEF